MTKSQNFSAKTIDEAKALAARAFGVPMSEIRFEVVEEPKRVFLGITKGNATVRATYESIDVSTADRSAVETSAEAAPAAEPSVLEKVAEDAKKIAQDAIDNVAPIVEDVVNEVKPVAESVVNEVKPVAESVVNEVKPVAESVINEVKPIAESIVDEVKPIAKSIVDEVKPVAESVGEEIASFAEKTGISAPAAKPEAEAAAPVKPAEKPAEERAPLQLDEELITGEPSPAALQKIEKAKAYLLSVLKAMDVEAELVVNAGAESAMIDIVSQNSGTVIGKRGETLDALQYLTFMIANRGDKEYYRIILNSANYRERRRKTLEELAAKIAKNVLRSGRQTTLEPMNPYERRIIHSAIAEIEGVSSRSVGEEPYRKVIISSTAKPQRRSGGRRNDRNDRGDRNDRRDGRDRRNNRVRDRRRSNDLPSERISMDSMKTSFEKDYKRPKAEDEINAGLYGKIEF